MNRILITGKDSYIGTSVEKWLSQFSRQYQIDTIDMKGDDWKTFDFSKYDVVFHVAGLAHSDVGKVSEKQKALYYEVNRNLTIETAKWAKQAGVKQFIFMSSIIVYGDSAPVGKRKVITAMTNPNPVNFYGDSKLQAENGILALADKNFHVAIIRPPMIYGKDCKGNYHLLSDLARKTPLFPKIQNERSMLHIDNLCEFIHVIIDLQKEGILFPQNDEYVCTSDLVKVISETHNKNILLIPYFNWMIKLLSKTEINIGRKINKVFGNLVYSKELSADMKKDRSYIVHDFKKSVYITEKNSPGSANSIHGNRKVLLVASVASMLEQFNMPNIQILQDLGYKVEVACNFNEGNTITEEKIKTFKQILKEKKVFWYQIDFDRNALNIFKNKKAYNQLYNILIHKGPYAFMHCHSPIGGVVGRITGHRTGTKVIYTAHGFHFYKGASLANWLLYYPVEKYLSRYTEILITINKEDKKTADRFHADQVRYVPGIGIDTDKYKPVLNSEEKLQKRKELGLFQEIVLLSVGELNKNKNHKIILHALSKLDTLPVKYIICGKGSLESELKRLAQKLNIQEKVQFLGYRTDIKELYEISDIFIFPSKREGLSVSLMEAMASGLPVICSQIRGNVDLVNHKKNGILCRTKSDYIQAISHMVQDKNIREKYSVQSLQSLDGFEKEKVMRIMKHIYTVISE